MLYSIFSTVFPVFGMIFAGLVLKRSRFIRDEFFKEANRLAYWVALPCLLFYKIAMADLVLSKASRVIAVMFIATTSIILLAWLTAAALRMKARVGAAFVHGAFRGNLAYIGLPVILYSLQSADLTDVKQAEALAVICLAPIVPFYNVVAIMFLQPAGTGARPRPAKLAIESLKNPLLMACVLGLAVNLLEVHIAVPIARALDLMAQAALPLTLLALGASLSLEAIRRSSAPAGIAALFKLIACPAIALLLARAFGLGPTETRIAVCFMAAPTAVAAYVMTEQMNCDSEITGSTVVLTTILSIITFSIVILIT